MQYLEENEGPGFGSKSFRRDTLGPKYGGWGVPPETAPLASNHSRSTSVLLQEFAKPMRLFFRLPAALLSLALATPLTAVAQDSSGFGKLDPVPPANLTPEQIITKFAAREAEFAQARENYIFRQSVKVDIIDDDTKKVDGEYQQVTDIPFSREGKREEHVIR